MSDTVTDRVAAIVNKHTMWPSLGGGGLLQCVCGLDELLLSQYSAHVAQVIVEQLGLTEEKRLLEDGYGGISIGPTGVPRSFGRAPTRQLRLVGPWRNE